MKEARCYEVVGYWPEIREKSEDGKTVRVVRSGKHVAVLVVTSRGASRAAALVEAKYPGMTVDGVNTKGNREVIDDTTEAG